jgi:hypothetical protein
MITVGHPLVVVVAGPQCYLVWVSQCQEGCKSDKSDSDPTGSEDPRGESDDDPYQSDDQHEGADELDTAQGRDRMEGP